MTLPSTIEYSSAEIREAYSALAKERDGQEQRWLRVETQLREARSEQTRIENGLKQIGARLEKFKNALIASKGTAAESEYRREVKAGERELAAREERLEKAAEKVSALAGPHDEEKEKLDAVERRLRAMQEAV